MNLTIQKSTLLPKLELVAKAADARSTMPVLGDVKLLPTPEGLTLAATDLYHGADARVETVKQTGDAGCCVSARDLVARIKAMGDDEIVLKIEKNSQLLIKQGKRRFHLHARPAEDFPEVPTIGECREYSDIEPADLVRLIDKVAHAISADTSRPHLNSMLFRVRSGALTIAATDGHRMAVVAASTGGPDTETLLPRGTVERIRGAVDGAESATLRISDTIAEALVGGSRIWVKTTNADFPPYEQVIPTDPPRSVTCNRAALIGAVRAVSVACEDRTGGVTFAAKGEAVSVSAESAEHGDATDEVPAECQDVLKFKCNARYMLDALGAIEADDVTLRGNDELDPVLIEDGDTTQVVMPMR